MNENEKKITLTEDQWDLYIERYSKLMWKIAHMINGDSMVASLEDNYADLCAAALESINGFHRKTGMIFEEMVDEPLFDKYTKTCLWTAKARKGNKITKKFPLTNNTVSLSEHEEVLEIPASATYSPTAVFEGKESLNNLPASLQELVHSDDNLCKKNGNLNYSKVRKSTKMSAEYIKKLVHKSMEE